MSHDACPRRRKNQQICRLMELVKPTCPSPWSRPLPLQFLLWREELVACLLLSQLLDEDGEGGALRSHLLDESVVVLPLRLQTHLKTHLR